VENHFTTTINVHSLSNNEAQLIAEIPPNTVYNIPLQSIHAVNKDLHFSMNGYKLSVLGFSWKENPSDYNLLKSLQCDPVKTYEPLYMNVGLITERTLHSDLLNLYSNFLFQRQSEKDTKCFMK
jgi:hypothetical protein